MCTLVQAPRLCTGRPVHGGSGGIALLFMTTALEGVRRQLHAPSALNPGKDPIPIVQEAGLAPGSIWTDAGNLTPTGI